MSSTRPIEEINNLQIVRTRHPPVVFTEQFALLQTEAGVTTSKPDIQRRLELIPRSDRLLMAIDGKTLLGFAHLRLRSDLVNDHAAELLAIVVREAYRRRGIGRQLFHAAETWAREAGCNQLVFQFDVTRAEAHEFFAALNCDHDGTLLKFIRTLDPT
jgi:GNAT superfamily N-acetyltransferase